MQFDQLIIRNLIILFNLNVNFLMSDNINNFKFIIKLLELIYLEYLKNVNQTIPRTTIYLVLLN
jgi:hypothetical protein